jgi:transposase
MTAKRKYKLYSLDLRERVLALYAEGLKTGKVASTLKVSTAWARRIKQKHKAGESIEAKQIGGSKPKLDEAARQKLASFVAEQPDATLAELQKRVEQELKISISIAALAQTLLAMKLTLKKSRSKPANSRVRM